MLEKDSYLTAFHSESTALAEAARLDPQAPLPSCPGWTIATLLGHLGAIYISIAKNIRVGQGEDVVHELEDLELTPEFANWFEHDYSPETTPSTVIEWYQRSAADLEAAFRGAETGERAWTWFPPDQSVGFWLRRMTQETAVHRWDAQLAHHQEAPIARELAQDGIDEALTVYQPQWCRPESQVSGNGETYRFDQTDGPGNWIVRFEGKDMEVRQEHAEAGVTLAGTASDLLLFLWHRIPLDRMAVESAKQLSVRYFEFVPPD
jgi:uncharacterized protein (TIGR03083 family)